MAEIQTPEKASTPKFNFLITILLISLTTLGGTVFKLWQTVQQLSTQEITINTNSHSQLQLEQNQLNHTQQQMTNIEKRLNSLSRQFILHSAPTPWANASHFILLASYQLTYLHNAQGGTQWLKQARASLNGLDDPQTNAIKQRLEQEINGLNEHPSWQIDQLLAQLQQVDALLSKLNTPTPQPKPIIPTTQPINSPTNQAKHFIQQLLTNLSNLIIIERHANATELSPTNNQQHQQIMHRLRITLQQAQWAVMYQHPKFYQVNIRTLQSLLSNHFNQHNLNIQKLQALLSQLDTADITPSNIQLEDILNQLQQAQQRAGSHHALPMKPTKADQPSADENPAPTPSQIKPLQTSGLI